MVGDMIKHIFIKALVITVFAIILAITFTAGDSFAAYESGEEIYDDWCAQCHGYDGDADAYSAEVTFPKPRDFTFGVYKFRSTPTGDPPTDKDMIKIIRNGNPGTSMPPWKRFTDKEVNLLVEYLKEFEPETFEFETEPIEIGTPPKSTLELIEKGKELFKVAKCIECHGAEGRGNGKKGWEANFRDDWDEKIYPANYTHPWELRNGSTLEDIFRTITTGLSGSPMTSYQDSLTDEERWSLALFIKSLQIQRKLGIALTVDEIENLPSSVDDPLWDKADYIDLPMAGQIIFEPRHFTPTITNVRVRGVYTKDKLALMLEWTDKRPNGVDDRGKPSDAARIQLPSSISGGSSKPYFFMGHRGNPVNIWQWQASDNSALEYTAKGVDNVRVQSEQDLSTFVSYDNGLYKLVFIRELNTSNEDDLQIVSGKFIPFSVALYDGENDEEGLKAAVSAWYFVMLKKPSTMKVYLFPPMVSLLVFGACVFMHRKLRVKGNKGD
jgi:DMSO reductase family type II enzyme heme b subunit